MGFVPPEPQEIPETLQKPEWIKCVVVTSLQITVTLSSVAVGALVGYTFCYIGNRTTTLLPDSRTHEHSFQVMNPLDFPPSFKLGARDRTINGSTSVPLLKIFRIRPSYLINGKPPMSDIRQESRELKTRN